MKASRTLVSISSSIQDDFVNEHLKLCFLWYDEVLIESLFNYNILNKIEGLSYGEKLYLHDIIHPLEAKISKKEIDAYRSIDSLYGRYPRWYDGERWNYTYREPQNVEEYAYNKLLEYIISKEGFDDEGIMYFEGATREAVDSIMLWEIVNKEIPCMLQANKYEKFAMNAALSFDMKFENPNTAFVLFECSIPSLKNVPWSDIIKMRKKNSFSSLHIKLGEILNNELGDVEKAKIKLRSMEQEIIDEIIEQYKPNIKKVTVETLVGNAPTPFFNPSGMVLGIRDIKNEINKMEKYNWFYLLRDIQKMGNR